MESNQMELFDRFNNVTSLSKGSVRCTLHGWKYLSILTTLKFFFSYLRDLEVTKTGTGPFIEWLYREKRCEMQYLMLTAAFAN